MPTRPIFLKEVANAGLSSWDAKPFLKKVTDIVPSIIYVFNQKTQSNEYSNRSIGALMGYSEAEITDMGSALIPSICHPDDLPLLLEHFGKITRLDDGEVIKIDYRVRHKLGHWLWLMSYDTVFERDGDGSVLRHIGVANDITLLKHAEERALAEKLKATTVNDELRAFAYSLSHDMKAPSNTLNLLLTELLDSHRDTMDPDAVQLVDMALGTVGRMSLLVDDVMHYTAVINQDLTVENVDLGPLVRDVVGSLNPLVRKTGARISIGDLPRVIADPSQIAVYFQHMIENAMQFARPQIAPEIVVSAQICSDLKHVSVTVQDNGLGIDADQHEKIFTIFKRLNPKQGNGGTGMGLAICRRIAANHGSRIELVSAPAEGAAFTIGLPLA